LGIGDCIKCYDQYCSCGWEYRDWSICDLNRLKRILAYVIRFREINTDGEFSKLGEKETKKDKLLMKLIKRNEKARRYIIKEIEGEK
jgi:hypothetical protein